MLVVDVNLSPAHNIEEVNPLGRIGIAQVDTSAAGDQKAYLAVLLRGCVVEAKRLSWHGPARWRELLRAALDPDVGEPVELDAPGVVEVIARLGTEVTAGDAEPDWAAAREAVNEMISDVGGMPADARAWARNALDCDPTSGLES